MQRFALVAALVVLVLAPVGAAVQPIPLRSLDGNGNNVRHPDWGMAGTQYVRSARPSYADNVGSMVSGPPTRYVSNRIFNDIGPEPVLRERRLAVGLGLGPVPRPRLRPARRDRGRGGADRLQRTRSARVVPQRLRRDRLRAHAGGARDRDGRARRASRSTRSRSYIDASNVYGVDAARLDWLRAGPVDGNPAEQRPRCC